MNPTPQPLLVQGWGRRAPPGARGAGGPHAAQAVLPSRDCLGVQSAPWHVSGTWEEPAQTWGDRMHRGQGPTQKSAFFFLINAIAKQH